MLFCKTGLAVEPDVVTQREIATAAFLNPVMVSIFSFGDSSERLSLFFWRVFSPLGFVFGR